MKEYINLEQLTLGCVSGKASEWQVLGVEARQALDEIASLRSELARLREAAELLARDTWRLALGKCREYGTFHSKVTDFVSYETMDNPTGAALIEEARKEKS